MGSELSGRLFTKATTAGTHRGCVDVHANVQQHLHAFDVVVERCDVKRAVVAPSLQIAGRTTDQSITGDCSASSVNCAPLTSGRSTGIPSMYICSSTHAFPAADDGGYQ